MKFLSTVGLFLLLTHSVKAEVVVIVSINNPNTYTGIDAELVERIFLGKTSQFSDGSTAVAYDLPKGNESRAEFAERYLDKSESQLNSYWSRRVFAGKQQPPNRTSGASDMKAKVAGNPNAIGYLDSKDVDPSVVVIHSFK